LFSAGANYKPVFVPLRAIAIRLGRTLLHGSLIRRFRAKSLATYPEVVTERAAPPPLFGLAPRGVCPASRITPSAVRSYRTISPLPGPPFYRQAQRYIFCGTFRKNPFERFPPAVSRHVALWRPDFPLACASGYPSCTCQCSVSHDAGGDQSLAPTTGTTSSLVSQCATGRYCYRTRTP
jgi:hypothetical protein